MDATNTVFILLARVKTLRDMGGCISPFNSFQLIQGLETLSLRCKAHNENANALAAWLNEHPMVKKGSVLSPSLASHPSHELAKKYPHSRAERFLLTETRDGISDVKGRGGAATTRPARNINSQVLPPELLRVRLHV